MVSAPQYHRRGGFKNRADAGWEPIVERPKVGVETKRTTSVGNRLIWTEPNHSQKYLVLLTHAVTPPSYHQTNYVVDVRDGNIQRFLLYNLTTANK